MNRNTIIASALLALTGLHPIGSPPAAAQTRTPPLPTAARVGTPQVTAARAVVPAQPMPSSVDERMAETMGLKGGEVIARAGTSDVTAEEVRATITLLDPRQQASLARDPALLSQTVRAILSNRLLLKEALSKKWDQQPKIVAQLARVRENQIVESYLQSLTEPPQNYPSEAEIKSVYDANASAFTVPRRFQLAQIVIAVAKDAEPAAEDAARKKIDDLVRKVKQPGADFGALARNVSDEASTAARDGEIGWVGEPDLRPEIRSQVFGLAKGAVTDPVRLEDGWHILKLLDTEASRTKALVEVRDALVQRIRAERAEANRRAYIAELLKQTPPVVNEIALSKLLDARLDTAAAR